jgi:hypothetical protein
MVQEVLKLMTPALKGRHLNGQSSALKLMSQLNVEEKYYGPSL